MKAKSLFAISLMSMALFACSDDDAVLNGSNSNENVVIENGVPVTLKLKMPDLNSRALS